MQALGGLALLPMVVVGFTWGGLLGAFTGFVVTLAAFSGFAILLSETGTGVDASSAVAPAQRLGGAVAAVGALVGAMACGWSYGWIGAGGGYLLGMAVTLMLGRATPRQ